MVSYEDLELFTEQVSDCFSDDFYDQREEWILNSRKFQEYIKKSINNRTPELTAKIIERLFMIKSA